VFLSDPPHPGLVRFGALLEHGWLNGVDAHRVLEKVDEVLGALQPLDVAAQDNAVPAGVDELDNRAQDCRQSIHGKTLLKKG
jgi:hypothetical protein